MIFCEQDLHALSIGFNHYLLKIFPFSQGLFDMNSPYFAVV